MQKPAMPKMPKVPSTADAETRRIAAEQAAAAARARGRGSTILSDPLGQSGADSSTSVGRNTLLGGPAT